MLKPRRRFGVALRCKRHLDGNPTKTHEISATKAQALIDQGIITDGMIVKVNAALGRQNALERPVEIASWRHAEKLTDLFNGMAIGTRILA